MLDYSVTDAWPPSGAAGLLRRKQALEVVLRSLPTLSGPDLRDILPPLQPLQPLLRAMSLLAEDLPPFLLRYRTSIDPLTANELERQLSSATWQIRPDRTLELAITFAHPALEVAVAQHLRAIEPLLAQAAHSDARLATLPYRAELSARAELDAAGRPVFVNAGARFHLAEERIRELLMGENLYGDAALALRELYQNAVDALRHRDARMELLRRTDPDGGWLEAVQNSADTWHELPGISVTEVLSDDGIRYLECRDHGIGMGLDELTIAFCQAGVRSGDLPEHIEERERFAQLEPPIELCTNSRFGIGTMSYFMVADSVEISTARLNADGTTGNEFQVVIPGPGEFFRIRDLGPAVTPGTRVRLRLRPGIDLAPVACLRDLVIVCPYRFVATDSGASSQEWKPGELNTASRHVDTGENTPVSGAAGRVWWIEGDGAVLADGIWAGTPRFGAVVDLAGPSAPKLTVDRRSIVDLDEGVVESLLVEATDELARSGSAMLGRDSWLARLLGSSPLAADALVERLADHPGTLVKHPEWPTGTAHDLGLAGYLPGDERLFLHPSDRDMDAWRVSALLQAGDVRVDGVSTGSWPQVVAARPTDGMLLGVGDGIRRTGVFWAATATGTPVLQALAASLATGRSFDEVWARQVALGLVPSDFAAPDPADVQCLSAGMVTALLRAVVASRPGRPLAGAFELHLEAEREGIPLARVALAMSRLGLELPAGLEDLVEAAPTASELIAASATAAGSPPWTKSYSLVGFDTIREAADRLHTSPHEVVAMLKRLGFVHLAVHPRPDVILSSEDAPLLRLSADPREQLLERNTTVTATHVEEAARRLGRTCRDVGSRLRDLGYTVPDGALEEHRPAGASRVTLVYPEDAPDEALDPRQDIPLAHLAAYSRASGIAVSDLIAAAESIGYRVAAAVASADELDGTDLAIASVYLDGQPPFLPTDVPVALVDVHVIALLSALEPSEVADRLIRSGYAIAAARWRLPKLTPEHVRLRGLHFQFDRRGLDPRERVAASRVISACVTFGWSVDRVVRAFGDMGFTVDDPRIVLPRVCPGPHAASA
jgi:hypothetical protein